MPTPAETAAFLTRNVVDALPEGALERKLEEGRQLRVKLGVDPTSPDIHLGHTVVLRKLREFQDLGHKVVLIIGDYTARVGDPSGRSKTRPHVSGAEIDEHARTYQDQAMHVLSGDPEVFELRRNSEWLDMPMERFFELARVATAAQILERDDFAKRWAAREPISILELLYPLLQGYDSVAVRSDIEIGGTDQKFNLLLARDIQRAYGVPEQSIITMPILVGTDGTEKMSKSLGNYVGVTDAPDQMYGKTLSVPDEAMGEWYARLLDSDPPADLGPRDAKHALARAIVERYHGPDAAEAAARDFERVFVGGGLPEQIEEAAFASNGGTVHLPALIADLFGGSRSEARRKLAQGGVRLDGEPLGEADQDIDAARLEGAVLQIGKRQFRRLHQT
jgi:tyrosyl-tRNA synthetase